MTNLALPHRSLNIFQRAIFEFTSDCNPHYDRAAVLGIAAAETPIRKKVCLLFRGVVEFRPRRIFGTPPTGLS